MILRVDGKRFDFFSRFTIDLKYDAVASGFSFDFFFDRSVHSSLHNFRSFSQVKVEHAGETIITGRIVNHKLRSNPEKRPNNIAGYSLGGVLEDSTTPSSLYPLQVDGLNLKEITRKLIAPFDLIAVIDVSIELLMDEPYTEIKITEGQSIKSFLSELASLKGIVLSHTENGSLLFTKANPSSQPVINIPSGGIPELSMELEIDGQGLHSEVLVLKDPDPDLGASEEATQTMPYCNITKTATHTVTAGDDVDITQSLKKAVASDLRSIKLTINFDRWDVNRKIIRPGDVITVRDSSMMMKNKVRWFVQSVRLTGTNREFSSILTCCLPEVYTGETPTYVFA